MIRTFIIFIPFFTCALWMVAHRLFCSRSDTAPHLFALQLLETLFLFYDCCYADVLAPYDIQAVSILVAQLATPCLVPLCVIYLRRLKGARSSHPLQMLWSVLPAALLTSAIILFFMAGPENIAQALPVYYSGGMKALDMPKESPTYLFFVSAFVAYRSVNYTLIAFFVVFLIVYHHKCSFKLADFWRFLFKGGEIPVNYLQFFNLTLLFTFLVLKTPIVKDLVNSHPWSMAIFAVAMSLFIYFFCHIALFGAKRTIRLSELGNAWRYNYGTRDKDEVVARMIDSLMEDGGEAAMKHIQEKYGDSLVTQQLLDARQSPRPEIKTPADHILTAIPDSWTDEKLLSSLQNLMLEKQVFLQPRLTLADVADMLDSNTSYVSRLVNNAYNLGFPEFINILRIDYAEQYILSHREAKQEEIAAECGFLSASSFNNMFKKVTGMTPKVWIASFDRDARQSGKADAKDFENN